MHPPRRVDELSIADSFIMGLLRGWRLVQAGPSSADSLGRSATWTASFELPWLCSELRRVPHGRGANLGMKMLGGTRRLPPPCQLFRQELWQKKGKGKKGMWLDAHLSWKGKGKGKPKGKDGFRPVNAYASEMFLGGLEVAEVLEAASVESQPAQPHVGMIDCGATASAAPEAVVKGLIASLLTQDKGAKIELDSLARPYFRFGNGRWGRALCKVFISSSASGSPRHYSLYTLPNHAEYYQANFDRSSLVPVLIGMDYLGTQGVGMMIDFATGLAMNTKEPSPEIFQLQTSKKGRYVLDIVQYLTQGHSIQEGQAHAVMRSSPSSTRADLEQQVLELGTVWLDMTVGDTELDEQDLQCARDRMMQLYRDSWVTNTKVSRARKFPMASEAPRRKLKYCWQMAAAFGNVLRTRGLDAKR